MDRAGGDGRAGAVTWPRAARPRTAALTRALEIYRTRGLRATWFSALGEAGYRRLLAFERRLDQPVRAWASDLPLRVDRLRRFEVDEYRTLRPDYSAATIRRRLAEDQACVVGRAGGRIVTAGWVVRGRVSIAYLGGDVELERGEAYLYDWFTEPRSRGHGAGSLRLACELRELRRPASTGSSSSPFRRTRRRSVRSSGWASLRPGPSGRFGSDRGPGSGRAAIPAGGASIVRLTCAHRG